MSENERIIPLLERIASALERAAPAAPAPLNLDAHNAYVWEEGRLKAVESVKHVPLSQLLGIDHIRDILLVNTHQFTAGHGANNALLWGARGMGKSSLIKAIHADINQKKPGSLVLVEIHRDDITSLPALLTLLKASRRRFIIFCDDLAFEGADTSYKSLKSVLDGGIEGRPENVLLYATSNRRHLMPRQMIENEQQTAIHPSEAVEEKVSLSDRFGLWLGFYACNQEIYLKMVDNYAASFKLNIKQNELHQRAIEWTATRGARSGRVAWQFIQSLRGELGK